MILSLIYISLWISACCLALAGVLVIKEYLMFLEEKKDNAKRKDIFERKGK